jgi:hypothetical protein
MNAKQHDSTDEALWQNLNNQSYAYIVTQVRLKPEARYFYESAAQAGSAAIRSYQQVCHEQGIEHVVNRYANSFYTKVRPGVRIGDLVMIRASRPPNYLDIDCSEEGSFNNLGCCVSPGDAIEIRSRPYHNFRPNKNSLSDSISTGFSIADVDITSLVLFKNADYAKLRDAPRPIPCTIEQVLTLKNQERRYLFIAKPSDPSLLYTGQEIFIVNYDFSCNGQSPLGNERVIDSKKALTDTIPLLRDADTAIFLNMRISRKNAETDCAGMYIINREGILSSNQGLSWSSVVERIKSLQIERKRQNLRTPIAIVQNAGLQAYHIADVLNSAGLTPVIMDYEAI